MFKVTQEYESALKHLQLALVDNSPCTADKNASKYIFFIIVTYKILLHTHVHYHPYLFDREL